MRKLSIDFICLCQDKLIPGFCFPWTFWSPFELFFQLRVVTIQAWHFSETLIWNATHGMFQLRVRCPRKVRSNCILGISPSISITFSKECIFSSIWRCVHGRSSYWSSLIDSQLLGHRLIPRRTVMHFYFVADCFIFHFSKCSKEDALSEILSTMGETWWTPCWSSTGARSMTQNLNVTTWTMMGNKQEIPLQFPSIKYNAIKIPPCSCV